jgi:hypothetical protein
MDESRTPYCVIVDFDSAKDGIFPLRDSMQQERISLEELALLMNNNFFKSVNIWLVVCTFLCAMRNIHFLEYMEAVDIVSELFRTNQWANNECSEKYAILDNNTEIRIVQSARDKMVI